MQMLQTVREDERACGMKRAQSRGKGNDTPLPFCVHVFPFTVGFKKANDNAFVRCDTTGEGKGAEGVAGRVVI